MFLGILSKNIKTPKLLSENYNTVDRDALYQNALSRGFRRRLATVSLGALVIK